MKLSLQQLEPHLAKTLSPIYIIAGDESLLVQEAIDAIRHTAKKSGFIERIRIPVESGSDWSQALHSHTQSLSLFSTQRILEIDLTGAKLTASHSKLLQEIAAYLSSDTLLLIRIHKLDAKAEKSAWVQALEKKGTLVTVWPIPIEQLPNWIMQRAKKLQLNITASAASLLASLVEGNLLAASQELEKLSLLQMNQVIDNSVIESAVSDHAHFDLFTFVDSFISGDRARSLRILENLRAEDTEPTLILWAITRELRMLAEMAQQMKQGVALSNLFSQFRIWEKRQANIRRFLQKHSQQACWNFLTEAAKIDRIIKGGEKANIWNTFQGFVLISTS